MSDTVVFSRPEVHFTHQGHYFTIDPSADMSTTTDTMTAPLSVILQVTRRCNFDCTFCSEIEQMADPTLKELEDIRDNLLPTKRVFLSGGEPLLRRDFVEIADMFRDFIVGVPTNAVTGTKLAGKLAGRIGFVNVGLEGPRTATNRVRGDFDSILRGIYAFKAAGIPLSLSAVVLRSLLDVLPFTYQIADVLEAGKLKLIHPIRKGNGINLPDSEFLTLRESNALFDDLVRLRAIHGWKSALRMTTWTPETEGYSILVYPDGTTWAWPVYGGFADGADQAGPADKVLFLGNLHQTSITEIWDRYPYKENHVRKYLGRSIRSADRVSDTLLVVHQ